MVGDDVSADFCSCWTALDTFEGHILQLHCQGPHKQTGTCRRNSRAPGLTPVCIIASTLPLVLQWAASLKMRCIPLEQACHHRHPALNKMSIFILGAELVWCLCYIQCRCISFLFKVTKMKWKNSMSGTWKLPLQRQDGRKQRGETLHHRQGGLGCHGSVTLCVGYHYDNKHSSTFHGRPFL